ncbi:MAG: hypothetical protein WC272_06185 [Sulfurimonas sp.]|nr:hypothetical protein [Sulfurimonas sp.]
MNSLITRLETPQVVYTLSFIWLAIITTNIVISSILLAELV